jgi:hypothetical protein
MSDNQQNDSGQNETPVRKLFHLASSIAPAIAGVLTITVGSGLFNKVVDYFDPPIVTRVWQVQDGAYKEILANLTIVKENMATLQKLVIDNPEAAQNVRRTEANVGVAIARLQSSPSVEHRAEVTMPSFVSIAFAQGTSTPPDSSDNLVRNGLLGFLAILILLFTLLYMKTNDKGKKTFSEKTITSLIGFICGMLTGAKLK